MIYPQAIGMLGKWGHQDSDQANSKFGWCAQFLYSRVAIRAHFKEKLLTDSRCRRGLLLRSLHNSYIIANGSVLTVAVAVVTIVVVAIVVPLLGLHHRVYVACDWLWWNRRGIVGRRLVTWIAGRLSISWRLLITRGICKTKTNFATVAFLYCVVLSFFRNWSMINTIMPSLHSLI